MAQERDELLELSRDELVTRARRAGVGRAELLTRVELADEIRKRTVAPPEVRRARGLLGRARDLLATVIERGLHLPDAAQRVRTFPIQPLPTQPEPVATVTLAEIYAAQGHVSRALVVLDEVLALEPEHAAALALRGRLQHRVPPETAVEAESSTGDAPEALGSSEHHATLGKAPTDAPRVAVATTTPAPAPVVDKPIPMLDDVPLPSAYGVDEAVVMPVDPTTAYVYWEVRPETVARVRAQAARGRLVVRVDAEVDGHTTSREIDAERATGDYFLFGLPPGAVLRASLAWASPDALEPLALSPSFSAPPRAPWARMGDTVVAWSAVPSRASVPVAAPEGVALAIAIAQARETPASAPSAASTSGASASSAPVRPLGSSEHGPGSAPPLGSSELAR